MNNKNNFLHNGDNTAGPRLSLRLNCGDSVQKILQNVS